MLSFVFNHNTHFEVSNTIKEMTAQRGAWVIVRSFVFRAGEIAVESVRGMTSLVRGCGGSWVSLFTGVLHLPSDRCVWSADSAVSGHTLGCRPSCGCFTPRHYWHLTLSALLRSERETTYRHLFWSKRRFFQAAQNHFF